MEHRKIKMAQIKQADGQIEINCNANKLFDLWAHNTLQISKICPDKFPKLELLQGDNCHTPGAVICWTFTTPVGKHVILFFKICKNR